MTTIALRDCCRFLSGGTPSKSKPEYWAGPIPWFSPKDIKTFDLIRSKDHISNAAVVASATQAVGIGTIFVVGRSGVLAHTLPVGVARQQAAFNQDIKAIIPNSQFDADFVALFLKANERHVLSHGVKIGATVHSLKSGFIEALRIPVSHITEQRRIAAGLKAQLAAVEDARRAAQAQRDDVRQLKQAIIETAFAETCDAPRVRLGGLARTASGTTPSRSRKEYWQPPKYPWVRTAEVAFAPITSTGESISERALAECSLSVLPIGTVLIAMYGQGKTRGQSAVLRVPATINQACFAILPGESHDPDYLQLWLRHSYKALRAQSEARGGNQSNLNGAILNDFEIPLIPLDRQRTIVARILTALAEAERLSNSIQQRLADIDHLPARLLAAAFNPSQGQDHD